MKRILFTIAGVFVLVVTFAVNAPTANAATQPLCGTQVGIQSCVASNPSTINTCSSGYSYIPVTNGQLPASFAGQIPGNAAYACSTGDYYQFFDSGGNLAGATTGATGAFSGGLPGTTNFNSSGQVLPSVCTQEINSWGAFFNTTCWGPLISALISGSLVAVTSWMLVVAGLLFNWALAQTVIQFGQFVNGNVISGINTAWSAFRDISNIVIIGMFTFIAIATILGSVNYGAKKMISRVLIVAVLINFSLLFTKIIIDVSNFTAGQFASAAGNVGGGAIAQTTQQTSAGSASNTTNSNTSVNQGVSQPPGISGAFMKYAGVSSFGDTASAVYTLGSNPNGGAWLGLLYGIVTALLFLVAAIVLFYGSFLLISRALLMIFLMITSSIAFASYLVPSLSQGNYGWSMWWQTLLKNAVFAPLLMVLLWITLTIGNGFNATAASAGGAATLGQLIAKPQSVLNINALFGYIIVIGLLFASFRIASSFSTSIGGFNWANMISGVPVSIGSQLTGFLGRQTLGRVGALREENLKRRRDEAKEQGDEAKASRLNLSLDRSKRWGTASLAKKDFNAMNTSVGKAFAKNAGLSGILAGATKGGGIKKRAEAAGKEGEKVGKELVLSKEQKDSIRQTAIDEKMRSKDRDKQLLENQKKAQEEQLKIAKETAEKQTTALEHEKATHEKGLEVEQKTQTDLKNKHENILKSISEELGKHAEGTAQRNDAEVRYQNAKLARDSEMAAQDEKIKTVRSAIAAPVAEIQKKIDAINAPVATLTKDVAATNSALDNFDKKYEADAKAHADTVVKATDKRFMEAAKDQAASYAQRRVSNLPFALSPGDDLFAREARGALKKGQKHKSLNEIAKELSHIQKEHGEHGEEEHKGEAEKGGGDDHH